MHPWRSAPTAIACWRPPRTWDPEWTEDHPVVLFDLAEARERSITSHGKPREGGRSRPRRANHSHRQRPGSGARRPGRWARASPAVRSQRFISLDSLRVPATAAGLFRAIHPRFACSLCPISPSHRFKRCPSSNCLPISTSSRTCRSSRTRHGLRPSGRSGFWGSFALLHYRPSPTSFVRVYGQDELLRGSPRVAEDRDWAAGPPPRPDRSRNPKLISIYVSIRIIV
jgi:hypothetical protein